MRRANSFSAALKPGDSAKSGDSMQSSFVAPSPEGAWSPGPEARWSCKFKRDLFTDDELFSGTLRSTLGCGCAIDAPLSGLEALATASSRTLDEKALSSTVSIIIVKDLASFQDIYM
jgi:hypothetical protein